MGHRAAAGERGQWAWHAPMTEASRAGAAREEALAPGRGRAGIQCGYGGCGSGRAHHRLRWQAALRAKESEEGNRAEASVHPVVVMP